MAFHSRHSAYGLIVGLEVDIASYELPKSVVDIERWQRRLFSTRVQWLHIDAFDKWHASRAFEYERRKIKELATQLRANEDFIKPVLARSVKALSESERIAWANAHITLLQRMISVVSDETALFVAEEEIASWRDIAAGRIGHFDQNTFYIRYDPGLYSEIFGFGPSDEMEYKAPDSNR